MSRADLKAKAPVLVVSGFMITVLEPDDQKQQIVHSTKTALVDNQGTIRACFDAEEEKNRPEILRAVRQLSLV